MCPEHAGTWGFLVLLSQLRSSEPGTIATCDCYTRLILAQASGLPCCTCFWGCRRIVRRHPDDFGPNRLLREQPLLLVSLGL
jgi:hypothetical protein